MHSMNYRGTKRIISAVLVITVLFTMLLSAFFIAEHAGHKCSCEDCPVCKCIQQCESMLRGLGSGASCDAGAFMPLLFLALAVSLFEHFRTGNTPVSRKVRLNN